MTKNCWRQSLMTIGVAALTGLGFKEIRKSAVINAEEEAKKIMDEVRESEELKRNAYLVTYIFDNFERVNEYSKGDYAKTVITMSKLIRKDFDKEFNYIGDE